MNEILKFIAIILFVITLFIPIYLGILIWHIVKSFYTAFEPSSQTLDKVLTWYAKELEEEAKNSLP